MPWHVDPNADGCAGFAVIDEADNSVVGCYPTQLDAEDAIAALMAADMPTDTPATNADDLESSPHDGAEAILAVEIASSREVPAGRAARADKVGREERRGSLELRAAGDGTVEVYGYASRFNEPYTVTDMFGEYTETVAPGAFSRSIAEQDVRLYVNHEGMALARSSVNLTLAEDNVGLAYDARLDSSVSIVSDLSKLMRAGIMRESSFAFQPIRQEWNADYTERTLLEVKLYDVSIVSLPASPTANAGIRELVRMVEDAIDVIEPDLAAELIGRMAVTLGVEVREGKVLSATNAKLVRDAVDALQALLNAADGSSRDAAAMMVETAIVEIARRKR
jgi:Escherichia/Staphylococcus phage prohead protease